MNTEKETQVTENSDITEETATKKTDTEEITADTSAETSAEAEADTEVGTDTAEENGNAGIGELFPIGKETEESEGTETVEITEEPDNGFFGNLNIPSSSVLCIALAIVSVLLIILVIDKFRTKKPAEAKETPKDEEETPDTASLKGSVVAAYVHGIGAREDQQDSYSISDLSDQSRGVMAVVADGMGGLSNGSLVSGILARTFKERFRNASAATPADEILVETALYANMEVNQALANAGRSGSTLVSVIIREGRLHFLTVGDSHLYLYRNGALLLLNREHVYSEELAVRAVNRMTPIAQIKGDRQSKSLTSYFGIGNLPHIDRSSDGIKLVGGDKILLCSDGVYGTLNENQLQDALSLSVNEAAREIEEGIRFADAPHQDNYTALILEYNG